uniref:Uncharacterized protein n=1 Tax=Solanum tuberosum TaxID=4113 RepID=M1DAT1_SOLTU
MGKESIRSIVGIMDTMENNTEKKLMTSRSQSGFVKKYMEGKRSEVMKYKQLKKEIEYLSINQPRFMEEDRPKFKEEYISQESGKELKISQDSRKII